jgi:hypothetical protein
MHFEMNAGGAKRRLALSSSTAVLAMIISAPAFAQPAFIAKCMMIPP